MELNTRNATGGTIDGKEFRLNGPVDVLLSLMGFNRMFQQGAGGVFFNLKENVVKVLLEPQRGTVGVFGEHAGNLWKCTNNTSKFAY